MAQEPDTRQPSPDAASSDAREVLFPKLSDKQIAQLKEFGNQRGFADGETLFSAGDKGFGFFVVLEGAIRVVERSGEEEREVVVHEPGEFTGEVNMLSGEASPVTAIARGHTRVLQFPADCLKKMIAKSADVGDVILRAFLARRGELKRRGYEGIRLVGSKWSRETLKLKEFLSRNAVLFTHLDPDDDPKTQTLLDHFNVAPSETPVVICQDGSLLKNPSPEDVAGCIGLQTRVDGQEYDLVVIGAGPAGLAAAVYGASEGLSTLVLEGQVPGGQAGTSSKIENYLGFPTGISGGDLVERAMLQARKFGAVISTPRSVVAIQCHQSRKRITMDNGDEIVARSIIIATGADYRKLDAEHREAYEGEGIFYSATHMEAQWCEGEPVIVVGGGNSAGQAAVFLASHAQRAVIMIRGDSLDHSMSRYLIDRIERTDNLELMTHSEITAFHGNGRLEGVTIKNNESGDERQMQTRGVFVMIGAVPRTHWLDGCAMLDDKGFILTGGDLERSDAFGDRWRLDRPPYYLECSVPGIFAAGDARSHSIKRVASAVGEGSMAVKYVHEFLAV